MSACTFFGHRECPETIKGELQNRIESLISQGVDTFYVGNHGHFDSMVYHCLKQLRVVYPHIRVSVVLAYLPTERREFQDLSDAMYPEIEDGPPRFAIDRRNRWMIHASDHCLCYIRHTWGGAYRFARLAKKYGKDVINIADAGITL